MKTAIVTAADEKYVGFLIDLLDSIERCRPREAEPLDICVLDVGLSGEQKESLGQRVTRIVEPGWDYALPGHNRLPRHYQAMFARPQLPVHLPGYERYLWLDADVWLQDWRGIDLLLKASEQPVIAIAPEIHQAYAHVFRRKPALERELKMHYEASFDADTATWLAQLPVYNAGVWAMRTDVAYWQNWGDVLRKAVQRFTGFLTEQCSLNMAIYTGLVPAYPVPPWCNWMCSQALPMLDAGSRTLRSPLLPHEKISIVHLADVKREEREIAVLDGGTIRIPLTHAGTQGV